MTIVLVCTTYQEVNTDKQTYDRLHDHATTYCALRVYMNSQGKCTRLYTLVLSIGVRQKHTYAYASTRVYMNNI